MHAHQANEPELLSGEAVRRILSLGSTKYWDLVWSGQLRSVKIGRKVLIPRDALAEYIASLPSGSKADAQERRAA